MNERIEQLRTRLREDPSSRLFFQLGEALRKEGELEEAVEILRKGLESYPRYVAAWVSLGRALYALSSYAEAEEAFGKALELDPENPIAARMMGDTAMGREDWVAAIKSLKLARVFSPRDEELEERLAFVEERLAEQGLLEGAPTAQVAPPPVPAVPEAPPEAAPAELETTAERVPEDLVEEVEAEQAETFEEPVPEVEPVPEAEVAPEPETMPEEPAEEPVAEAPPTVEEPEPQEEAVAQIPAPEVEPPAEHEAEPAPPEPFEVPEPEMPPEVFSLSGDDPFAEAAPTGDTGVFVLGDDVFGAEEHVDDDAVETAAAPVTAPPEIVEPPEEPPQEEETFSDAETLPGMPVGFDVAAAAAAALADTEAVVPEAQLAGEAVEEAAEEALPLPTVTLARLALDQGDHSLAEETLLAVLERDPGNVDAGVLLEELRGTPAGPATEGKTGTAQAKIAALRGWLDRVRLAAEERAR